MALRLRLDRPIRVDEISAMASAAARGGRLAEAERLLREAVALEPSKSQPQEALSWVVLQQNRPIEAIELLDRLLTADPRNSSLATRRAWILGQLGRFDEAISAYLEQLHRNPDRPALHIALGRSLLAVGRDREAVACYRRALELGDRSGEAWWSLANVKTIRLSLSEIRDMAAFLVEVTFAGKRQHGSILPWARRMRTLATTSTPSDIMNTATEPRPRPPLHRATVFGHW